MIDDLIFDFNTQDFWMVSGLPLFISLSLSLSLSISLTPFIRKAGKQESGELGVAAVDAAAAAATATASGDCLLCS